MLRLVRAHREAENALPSPDAHTFDLRVFALRSIDEIEEYAFLALVHHHAAGLCSAGSRGFNHHRFGQVREGGRAGHRTLELEQQLQILHAVLELLLRLNELHVLLNHRQKEPGVIDRHRSLSRQGRKQFFVVLRELAVPAGLVEGGWALLSLARWSGRTAALRPAKLTALIGDRTKPDCAPFVEHLDHADGSSDVILHRRRENRARSVARHLVPVARETSVPIGVFDPEGLPELRHVTSDP